MTTNEKIRANIIWLRKQHNLSQQQMANIIQVKRALVAAWEESRSAPQYDQLIAISDYFYIAVDEILRYELKKCYDRRVMLLPKLIIEIQ